MKNHPEPDGVSTAREARDSRTSAENLLEDGQCSRAYRSVPIEQAVPKALSRPGKRNSNLVSSRTT